jgi:hypothetical protein
LFFSVRAESCAPAHLTKAIDFSCCSLLDPIWDFAARRALALCLCLRSFLHGPGPTCHCAIPGCELIFPLACQRASLSLCRSFLWPVSVFALLIVLARGLDFLTACRTLRVIRDFWHQFDLQSLPVLLLLIFLQPAVGHSRSACVLLVRVLDFSSVRFDLCEILFCRCLRYRS